MIHYPNVKKETIDIKQVKFKDIDHTQSFFDSLRSEYEEFDTWFTNKAQEDAYIIENNKQILAMTAYKVEYENNHVSLKIRICKSEKSIYFLEWVILKALHEAIQQDIKTIYFTHFITKEDKLKDIAHTYGFNSDVINQRGENVFTKHLSYSKNKDIKANFPYIGINKDTKFFLIPIQKNFSNALFPKIDTPNLFNIIESSREGNAIEKIYVCASNTTKIDIGSVVLFYESQNNKDVVAMGSVIKINKIDNADDFIEYQNRSVFSEKHIDDILDSLNQNQELLVLSFILSSRVNKTLPKNIPIPQSINQLTKDQFKTILSGENAWKLLYQLDQNI